MSNAQVTLVHFRQSSTGEHGTTKDFMEAWANKWFKFWVFQEEQSDTGYAHWQGTGSLYKKRRIPELKNSMRRDEEFLPQYLEPVNSNEAKTIHSVDGLLNSYAAKADTRIAGPFVSKRREEYIPRQYASKELIGWQVEMLRIAETEIQNLDGRTVHWIFDWTGNHGKSVLSALIELTGKGIDMPACNDYEKLCASLADELMDTSNRDPGVIMIDLPRAMNKKQMQGFTTACEQWKKGKVVDMRNHYRKWWFNTPSVWIFSNKLPPMTHFSKGRWRIWCFDKEGLDAALVPYVPGMELTYGEYSPHEEDEPVYNPLHRPVGDS